MLNLSPETKEALKFMPGQRITILTVGNSLRSDDGIGPYIASKLKSKPKVLIIDSGQNPENEISKIVGFKPDSILIVDAADFGLEAGKIKLVDEKLIPEESLSTHSISLKVIAAILQEDSGAEIKFLGIQPETVKLKEGLSPAVKQSADEIISYLSEVGYA